MDLIKSYNELYATSKTYNELVVAEKREQKKFVDLENFLRQSSDDIKKYGLEADICKLFNKNADISINSIKSLIETKRKEEKDRFEREEFERQKKKTIIKWVIILILMATLTFMSFGIIWIFIGFILFKFPNLRNKLLDGIKNDWEKIIHK